MTTTLSLRLVAVAALVAAMPASSQAQMRNTAGDSLYVVASAGAAKDSGKTADSVAAAKKAKIRTPRYIAPAAEIQYFRPADKRGLNVFEAPKEEGTDYTGLKLAWGGAFSQEFQNLQHSNTAAPRLVNNVDQNLLIPIGSGFNTATANLFLNVQLARGIRVAVETYASTRHHNEAWVKDGYFQIDASPIENALLDRIMQVATLKVGHFEVNYGDQHFRRSDGGQTIYNPFVGNFVIDAFTTEIGAEAYLRKSGYMGMVGITGGEIKGQVTAPDKRAPTYLAKLGVDKQFGTDLRFRLTGSMYKKDASASGTLTSGDRAGSKYYSVLENTSSTEAAQAWSGAVQSGMKNNVLAFVVNPFVKVGGAEFFGNVETMTGAALGEASKRTLRQLVGEGLYRFADDQLYLGGRYNVVKGQLAGLPNDITVRRTQLGGGWYVTPNVLSKLEFVNQKYLDFPTTDIRNGGQFKGFMIEGVVAF
ncbi:MAG TPA: hypothetical protein VFI52_04075 [Gemmatimonadaceae bacterium]|nr:hypothetical protein [Gemmatimonadaceae bacterium]